MNRTELRETAARASVAVTSSCIDYTISKIRRSDEDRDDDEEENKKT